MLLLGYYNVANMDIVDQASKAYETVFVCCIEGFQCVHCNRSTDLESLLKLENNLSN